MVAVVNLGVHESLMRPLAIWLSIMAGWLPIFVAASGSTLHNRPFKKSLKQYNPHLRFEQRRTATTTSDTCASITMDLAQALNDALDTTIPEIFGNVNFCLCLKNISSFIQSNVICNLAVTEKGTASVTTAMINIVNNYSGKKSCSYPSNSLPACTTNNACAFTCTDGYTASGGKCMCNGYVCNEKCQSSKCANPSRAVSRRKSHTPTCATGYTMCGVAAVDGGYPFDLTSRVGPSDSGKQAYECIETKSNIESCGGCVVPLTISARSTGRDCTAIPNATAVSCQQGECIVEQCRKGHTPDTTRSGCTPT